MSHLNFQTDTYAVRPLTENDISQRWGCWFSQKETTDMLNINARDFSEEELKNYFGRFDQKTRILLGIFHRPSNTHIGIFSSIQSDSGREVLFNLLIGETEYRRNSAGLMEHRRLCFELVDYFFFTKKYVAIYASVLGKNSKVIEFLKASKWELVKRSRVENMSCGSDVPLEVYLLKLNADCHLKTRIRFANFTNAAE